MRRNIALMIFATTTIASPAIAQQDDAAKKPAGKYAVEATKDISYYDGKDADPEKHKLDLFVPKGVKGFPVYFFIHGGAWSSGDRRMYGAVGQTFARNGIGAVVISYRLSPKVTHPAHIEDVARAFAWTHKNISRYGGRPDQIFVSGQSAGGHLAALLSTNENYLKPHGLTLKDIKASMPISGVYVFTAGRLARVLGKEPGAVESASPIKHVSTKVPPSLILYADKDFPGCAVMSKAYGSALKDKQVESSVVEIKDRNHISIMVKLMFSETDPTTVALMDFIAAHTKEKKAVE